MLSNLSLFALLKMQSSFYCTCSTFSDDTELNLAEFMGHISRILSFFFRLLTNLPHLLGLFRVFYCWIDLNQLLFAQRLFLFDRLCLTLQSLLLQNTVSDLLLESLIFPFLDESDFFGFKSSHFYFMFHLFLDLLEFSYSILYSPAV